MSATPKGIKGPPKLIRILMLPLLLILLLLLVAYAALPYLPLRTPGTEAGVTPIAPLTEEPSATPAAATPTRLPSPTNTAVVAVTPTLAETEAPLAAVTPTLAETEAPSAAASPTEMPGPTDTPEVDATPAVAETEASPAAVLPTATPLRPPATPAPTETAEAAAADMQALEVTVEPVVPSPTATMQVVAALPTATVPGAAAPSTPLPPVATAAGLTLVPPPAAAPQVVVADLLYNNTFALGAQENGVAMGWSNFSNSHAEFSYRADDWPSVSDVPGAGQTMRIRNAELPDRYLGIYQTVNVIPGRVYTFSIAGLMRTNVGDVQHTDFGYRMEVGFDTLGGRNYKRVPEWFELPWDEQLRVQDSYRIDVFATTVEAETEKLTVFVRAWKKWADAGEGAYDVTRVSLVGPAVARADGSVQALGMPVTGLGEATLWQQIRIAITLVLLAVLVGGALWRLRPWQVR